MPFGWPDWSNPVAIWWGFLLVVSAANVALWRRTDNRAGATLTWPHGSVRMDARAVARRRAGRRARAPTRGSLSGAAGARGRGARLPAVRAGDRDRAGSRARPVRRAGSARCGVRHLAARPEALRALARVAGVRRGRADDGRGGAGWLEARWP